MSYGDWVAEHLRLAILRVLEEAPEYRANGSVLTDALALGLGLPATRDQVRTHIHWLREQGLVSIMDPAAKLLVVTATERGIDVALGRALVPGVRRPAPKA